ncbi:hypothetical protein QR680_010457 [Steinernema hermaphroditum]|uniref:Uncharacterized protein n=1 Tax=Steinernema hermaphroditum TaxID=289476 RepID=A0AA39IQM9_9BILA|nr:hypothetical protein QR680_010457 [Steinernema hermaphroditum]
MSLLPAVVSFALLASAISALPYYDPLYAPRGAPVAAYHPRLPYNYGMYPAYPQYYYNYFYGHPAYHYAPYGYTPREYAPEAYTPGQAYYYPIYDEEGRRFKGFWGDLKRTAVEIKDKIKNKAKGFLGRIFGKEEDEQVKPTQKVEEEKPVMPVEEVAEEPQAMEEQGFKSGQGLPAKISKKVKKVLGRICGKKPFVTWPDCVAFNAAKESEAKPTEA